MKQKEICQICENYSIDAKCDIEDSCKIAVLVRENKELKAKIKTLQKENEDLRIKMSYMVNPNALGNRHEMGSW